MGSTMCSTVSTVLNEPVSSSQSGAKSHTSRSLIGGASASGSVTCRSKTSVSVTVVGASATSNQYQWERPGAASVTRCCQMRSSSA